MVTEPSTAVCLTHEYPNLMDDDEARLVAENTTEACTFLWRLHQQGVLQLDLRPVNAALAYHMPCHIKALQVGSPTEHLLRLIPALSVQRMEKGCSGMAGTFGIKKANYRHQPAGRLGSHFAHARPGAAGGHDGMQRLQDPNGAGHQQTDGPSAQTARAGLRPDARSRRPADIARRRIGRNMNVRLKLFALAKELVGTGSLVVSLPEGAGWPTCGGFWRLNALV